MYVQERLANFRQRSGGEKKAQKSKTEVENRTEETPTFEVFF